MAEAIWYEQGLRFKCTQCGHCCQGSGYVWVDDSEIEALAGHLGLAREEFERRFTRRVGRGRSLREQVNDDCIFYDRRSGCTVYDARPRQCRTWPFWRGNVESEQAWRKTSEHCPGCNQGELFSVEEIAKRLVQTRL